MPPTTRHARTSITVVVEGVHCSVALEAERASRLIDGSQTDTQTRAQKYVTAADLADSCSSRLLRDFGN